MNKRQYPFLVVTPVYEDRASASRLFQDLAQHCPTPPHIIAVEDGSVHDILPVSAISDAGLDGEVLYLARNMGHQRAIATGLTYISTTYEADVVVVMDSDGEDRPASIPSLIKKLESIEVDAVVAERHNRSETFQFRMFYKVYRYVFLLVTNRKIRFGNFMALSMRSVRRLSAMQELWIHAAAALMISRLRVASLPIDRGKRYSGNSQMNFVSLTLHGLRSMMVFAEDVLVRLGLICALLAALALSLLFTSLVLKLSGFATPGWFSVAVGILILILMQAGIMTFVILMLSGLVRGGFPIPHEQLALLIERVESTRSSVAVAYVGSLMRG